MQEGPFALRALLSDHLDQNTLGAAAVELAVEDLFPGAEVEFASSDRDDDLTAHHLALMMRVAVVFAGAIVMIPLGAWVVRRQPFKPALVIFVKAGLVVIDEDRGGDVHRVDEAETPRTRLSFTAFSTSPVMFTKSIRPGTFMVRYFVCDNMRIVLRSCG